MDVRLHDDLDGFVALTQPFLEAGPVRHSIARTVLALLARVPTITVGTPLLLTVGRGDVLRGVAVCPPARSSSAGYRRNVPALR